MTGPADRGAVPAARPTSSATDEPTVVLPPVVTGVVPPRPEADATAPVVEQGAAPAALDTGSFARNSAAMAVGSVVSRATGYVRAAAIAAAIGAGFVGDDYTIANNLPNMVYELLLGGVLASVVIPLLVRARRDEPDQGQAYAQRLLTLAVVAIGAATVLVVLAAPLLTALLTNANTTAADKHLVTTLAYLLLPEMFFYGLAGIFAAILNTRGHFAAPMWTPILNNIVVIATAGGFALVRLGEGRPTPQSVSAVEVLILGGGTTLGIVVQAAGLWPALRRVGFRWRWRWDFRALHLGELARLGAWMLVYVGVNQVGIAVVVKLAKLVGDQGQPGPAVFNNAFLIFMMAHGIVAVSVITALMPRMSAAAADGRFRDVAAQLSQGTRLGAVILMPAAALYVALGRPLALTLFGFGNYSHRDAVATGWVIAVAGLGLVPFAISQLQTAAFYALRDTRTPALLNLPVVGIRLAIDVAFYLLLPAAWVTASLMGGTAASFVVAFVIGYWLLRRRIGRLGLREVANTLLRLGVAATVAAVPAAGVAWALNNVVGDGWRGSVIQLVAGTTVLVVVYVALALAMRVREVRQLATQIRSKVHR